MSSCNPACCQIIDSTTIAQPSENCDENDVGIFWAPPPNGGLSAPVCITEQRPLQGCQTTQAQRQQIQTNAS